MERWPRLSLRKADSLGQAHANAVTSANLAEYFSVLEETLQEHNLMNCPSRIFNMDESGITLDHKPSKVITLKVLSSSFAQLSSSPPSSRVVQPSSSSPPASKSSLSPISQFLTVPPLPTSKKVSNYTRVLTSTEAIYSCNGC